MAAPAVKAPLSLQWVFGFNKGLISGVHDLTTSDRQALLHITANSGVIFDYDLRTQTLLQGHTNAITACTVSEDKKSIVTADCGEDSLVVVWNSETGAPSRTLFNAHEGGVCALDLSADGQTLVTVSDSLPQQIKVWDLSSTSEEPVYSSEIVTHDKQAWVKFHPTDSNQIVTNGAARVVFWTIENDRLRFHSPPVSAKELGGSVGAFTCSAMLPGPDGLAVSGTNDGDIVVWAYVSLPEPGVLPTDRRVSKKMRLFQAGVSVLQLRVFDSFIVAGTSDGAVRFYDFKCRILAWYEDLELGPVTSLTFTSAPSGKPGASDAEVRIPNFIIGTSTGRIALVNASVFEKTEPEQRRGELLIEGFAHAPVCIAAHPEALKLATVLSSGTVLIQDIDKKTVVASAELGASPAPTTAKYDPKGRYLAIGMDDGTVSLLVASTLAVEQSVTCSKLPVRKVAFSDDGSHFAVASDDFSVAIFRFERNTDEEGQEVNWLYIGRIVSHSSHIVSLQFVNDPSKPPGDDLRLFSVGYDRAAVEYDLANSTVRGGVRVAGSCLIEQTSRPSCAVALPSKMQTSEGRGVVLLVYNNEYKCKIIEADRITGNQLDPARILDAPTPCVKTLLGPTFGAPPSNVGVIPCGSDGHRFLWFCCPTKVAGALWLPLDGNPHRSTGVIVHPGGLVGCDTSPDGRMLITCGGSDLSVALWEVSTTAVESASSLGGSGNDPFWAQLDGGADGLFADEAKDFFVYSQIKRQGEDTRAERDIVGWVRPADVPDLFCALGVYPSQFDIRELLAEVTNELGAEDPEVTLDHFVRLFVNHRPVFGLEQAAMEEAFDSLGALPGTNVLRTDKLVDALLNRGEPFEVDELQQVFERLRPGQGGVQSLPSELSGVDMAESVLGFAKEEEE